MISLTTETDATQFIRERVNSRLWWTIISASPDGNRLAQAIENKFYSGDNSQFFDMVMVPATNTAMPRISAIFFARKQEMSPKQLTELMQAMLAEFPEVDGSQDVLLTPDAPFGFMQWLSKVVSEACKESK